MAPPCLHRHRRHILHGGTRQGRSTMHLIPSPPKTRIQGPKPTLNRTRAQQGPASSVPNRLPAPDFCPRPTDALLPPLSRIPTGPAESMSAYPQVRVRPRPAHSPRTPPAQDYESSPGPATATSPHEPTRRTHDHAHAPGQGHGPVHGPWWQRWTHTQLPELQKVARAEPPLQGLVRRPHRESA